MLRFCTDENFNNNILRGLIRRLPSLDIVRMQDMGLGGIDDISLLNWTSQEKRILLTHDVKTMVGFAFSRITAGQSMPGLFEVDCDASIAYVVDDLLLIIECSLVDEWEGQVIYLPFRR